MGAFTNHMRNMHMKIYTKCEGDNCPDADTAVLINEKTGKPDGWVTVSVNSGPPTLLCETCAEQVVIMLSKKPVMPDIPPGTKP